MSEIAVFFLAGATAVSAGSRPVRLDEVFFLFMERQTFFAGLCLASLAGLLFAIDLRLPMGVAAGILYIPVILLTALLSLPRMPLLLAALCSALTIAGGVWSPAGGVMWMGATNRVLGIVVLWLTAILVFRRRRAEDRLVRLNQELEAFVRTVSHDLRSPLSPILGWADFLREQYSHCLQEGGKAAVEEIESQGRRMLALLDDLLQLAMVGYLERPPGPVDVDRVLETVLEVWREKAAAAGLELRHGKLPPAAIPENLLAQVFDNLVGNAVRCATGGGPIEIGGERAGNQVATMSGTMGRGLPSKSGSASSRSFAADRSGVRFPARGSASPRCARSPLPSAAGRGSRKPPVGGAPSGSR